MAHRTMQRPSLHIVSILAGLGLAACGEDPPAPAEVRERIGADLAHVLREANAAYAGSTESMPGNAATAIVERMLGGELDLALRARGAMARLTAGSMSGGRLPFEEAYDPAADIAFLNEKLFTDANHLGDGIYQVPVSLACGGTAIGPGGEPIESIDPECADRLARAELRIRVAKSGNAITFAVQLGADHDEPLTIGLAPNAVSVTVDLDDTWRAAVALAALYGEDLPNVAMAGQITGRLEILGAAHAKATLDIDRAVSIAIAEAGAPLDGPEAIRFSSAKAKVLALELDGKNRRGKVALGVGETKAHVASGTGVDGERFELDLPGLAATAAFSAGKPLELTGVSLGGRTASVSRNGVVATSIDLNPADGRAFAATIALDAATGRETLTVSPKLDVRLAVDHAAWDEEAPVYDVTQFLLDGSVSGDATGDGLEVLAGSLKISTNPAGYGFTAAAGQCVVATSVEDVPSGQFYTSWSVATCP